MTTHPVPTVTEPDSVTRRMTALFVAGAAGCIAPSLLSVLVLWAGAPRLDRVNGAQVICAIAVLHMLFLGWPVAIALIRLRRYRLGTMLVAGGLIGATPVGVLAWNSADLLESVNFIGLGVVFGMCGGLAFYLAYRACMWRA